MNTATVNSFDLQSLKQQYGNDLEFVKTLLDVFLEDAPNYIFSLRQALEQEDIELFHRTAHSFKSAAANITAIPVSLLAEQLEDISTQSLIKEQITPTLEDLSRKFRELQDEINRQIA